MDLDGFWALIDASRRRVSEVERDGSLARQAADLGAGLEKLPAPEIAAFHRIFNEQLELAKVHDLRGAAYLLAGGCSDDGFADFRSWLISLGRGWFERALKDPDSLAELDRKVEDIFFEEFASVAPTIYEDMTGDEIPDPKLRTKMIRGKAWKSEDELRRRLPRISELRRTPL